MKGADAVPATKQWHVTFSQSILAESVNTKNIYVTDFETEDNWPVDVLVDSTGKTIVIKPTKDYVKGKTYTLWIKDIQSTDKKTQGKRIYLDFTVN